MYIWCLEVLFNTRFDSNSVLAEAGIDAHGGAMYQNLNAGSGRLCVCAHMLCSLVLCS